MCLTRLLAITWQHQSFCSLNSVYNTAVASHAKDWHLYFGGNPKFVETEGMCNVSNTTWNSDLSVCRGTDKQTQKQARTKIHRPAVDSRRKMTVRTLKDCRLEIVIFLSSCGKKGGSRRVGGEGGKGCFSWTWASSARWQLLSHGCFLESGLLMGTRQAGGEREKIKIFDLDFWKFHPTVWTACLAVSVHDAFPEICPKAYITGPLGHSV